MGQTVVQFIQVGSVYLGLEFWVTFLLRVKWARRPLMLWLMLFARSLLCPWSSS